MGTIRPSVNGLSHPVEGASSFRVWESFPSSRSGRSAVDTFRVLLRLAVSISLIRVMT